MHIKSIILDGFKSYGQRTEIHGFDSMFNAITGLNGSGKSNILDGICFLLGITNLSQVRALNLQELVYKNGQAGVTKATVSITFDNNDKKQSPVGYEQYDEFTVTRQVVIGGRNKYLINGSNATNNRVQDLFRSVQLNVNNPHFLIMQGRITKVLNMKPPEILSMIEEAAGTRMYESKKLSAQKTIEKKDAKLKEIDSILTEEITPTLNRLKEERQAYLEYTKVTRELEHHSKLQVAWQFVKAQELCEKSAVTLREIKENIATKQHDITKIEESIQQMEENISELERKKDEETGGVLAQLEDNLKQLQMDETKTASDCKHKSDGLKEEKKKKKETQKGYDDDKNAIKAKEKELDKIFQILEELKKTSESDAEALLAAQNHFKAVSAGLSSNTEGEEATLAEQLMAAKNEIAQAETGSKQAEMKLKHAHNEIKKRESECKKTETDYKKDSAKYEVVEKDFLNLRKELDKINFDENTEEALQADRRRLRNEVENLRQKSDQLESGFPNLSFDYRDPEPNFDRRKVKGLVCELIDVRDPRNARALTVTAGGRLYNVVVDTEVTGKKLLEKGQLKKRVTIIPLNKISAYAIDQRTIKRAENLVGRDNVSLALSLIGYDRDVETAMQYVFGSTFVCPEMESAKTVTFDDQVKKRTVTLDGEVFDPAGTLTGGAINKGPNVLLSLTQLKEVREQLKVQQNRLQQVEQELRSMKTVSERFRNMKQQVAMKEREAELLKQRLEQTTHHQQLQELEEQRNSIREQEDTLKKNKDIVQKNEKRVKELQAKIKDAKSIRERELKAAETAITSCKKKAEESAKQTKVKQQAADSVKLELEELQKSLSAYEEQLKACDETLQALEQQYAELTEKLQKAKDDVAKVTEEVKAHKAELKSKNEEIAKLQVQREKMRKEIQDKKLQIQQLEHDVSKTTKESKDAGSKVQSMLSNHDWIAQEQQFFGVANTEFDFSNYDPKESVRHINKLQETKDKLAKNVNTRAHNMMSRAEEQYQDLIRKKRIVENDKAKIAAVIRELDEKKNQALREAWEKVNKDFGSIFSTLLPGTNAKLQPPEGMTVLDGLEVKVAFGDVWKESLNELSGGQRSLVALSLILSLLLFKPAPIYILDEVDAALDLSHTQNIGQIIRSHFKTSQFIVVSLKDGMFNNANVLFKTKFVDGSSTVSRFAQRVSSAPPTTSAVGKKRK